MVKFNGKNTINVKYDEEFESVIVKFKNGNKKCFEVRAFDLEEIPTELSTESDYITKFLECDLDTCSIKDIVSVFWSLYEDEMCCEEISIHIPYKKKEIEINVDFACNSLVFRMNGHAMGMCFKDDCFQMPISNIGSMCEEAFEDVPRVIIKKKK